MWSCVLREDRKYTHMQVLVQGCIFLESGIDSAGCAEPPGCANLLFRESSRGAFDEHSAYSGPPVRMGRSAAVRRAHRDCCSGDPTPRETTTAGRWRRRIGLCRHHSSGNRGCIVKTVRRHLTEPSDKEKSMALGPIELLVLGFPGNQFTGGILPEIERLVDNGVIMLVDALII